MSSKGKVNELCIDNRPTRTTSLFKIKAKLRINTTSQLRDLIITDDGACVDVQPPPPPVVVVKPLHLVFLVDTSDSFNKLDEGSSSAGEVIMDKFVGDFLRKGKFSARTQPTTITCIQFSGMGPDKNYEPGSNGVAVKGASLLHYKVELGPKNFAGLTDQQRDFEISRLADISTIDGNGQLYLALQDISMKGFQEKLDKAAGVPVGKLSTKYLIIVTDDEWDFNDLKLCSEIPQKAGVRMNANEKKKAIVEFAKNKFDEIHTCVVKDYTGVETHLVRRDSNRDLELNEFIGALGPHTYPVTRAAVAEFNRGGPAVTVHAALSELKRSLKEYHHLEIA